MRRVFGFVLLAFAVIIGFNVLFHVAGIGSSPVPAVAAVADRPAYVPDPVDLAARAPEYEILAACGKPARIWVTTRGRGEFEGQTKHFLYPKAEILAVAFPGDKKEQMRYWTFAGAFPRKGDQAYDGAELKKRMPCMARWADAWDQAGRDILARQP